MEKQELLNAMRLLQDHCEATIDCSLCPIADECQNNFDGVIPYDWQLEGASTEH